MLTQKTEHPALKLFTELLTVPSPSGREEQVARIIREKLDGWGYSHQTDQAGNVIVRLDGRRPEASRCCLTAHIDEIGMVVTRIEPDGSLRINRSGGLYPWKIGERPVDIVGDYETITGVLSMGSTHTPLAADKSITWADVRIITGLTPDQLTRVGVRPGSTAVPVCMGRGPLVFGDPDDPLVGAWLFDNRIGVVTLLRLLEALKRDSLKPSHPTTVAFTVQEEIGAYGAKVIAQREQPEIFIAVDGCPMPIGAPLQLDGRPGVWSKDWLIHYDQRLIKDLCQAASEAGTALQPVVYESAFSDASQVYSIGAAQRVGCIGLVKENSHGYEVTRLSAFDNLLNTCIQFITGWEG